MATKRLFIGIPIHRTIAKELYNFQLINKNSSLPRWVRSENYHITLYFIGTYPNSLIDKLISDVQNICSSYKNFILCFNSFCIAPERKPYMIWAKYDVDDTFIELSNSIATLFNHESSIKLIPHITLARFNNKKTHPTFKNLESNHLIHVAEVCLYQSVLKPSGAEYKILKNFRLNNA